HAGNWLVVWTGTSVPLGGSDNDIFISRSTDQGAHWSVAQQLIPYFFTDTGKDYVSCAPLCDSSGRWFLVWSSDSSLGGTLGTDSGVLFSSSANLDAPTAAALWNLWK